MKKIIGCLLVIIITSNCKAQNFSTELQQIEFKDKMLEKIFTNVTKSYCFNQNDFYVVDFFKSGISNEKYYLSIDKLMFNNKIFDSIAYYLVVNDTVFFIPKIIPDKLFEVLSVKKRFSYKMEYPHPGGDYNFLIYGTLNGYYKVIYNSCAE